MIEMHRQSVERARHECMKYLRRAADREYATRFPEEHNHQLSAHAESISIALAELYQAQVIGWSCG